ncbi:MAG: VIT1/CCC1 transporter family protein [Candidatus Nanohaloarchaeota archaeon QJJ-9]|nr:VIT1/CCC1 transporter family protein [Candidatus Nanohaloarchaeota archaeon QJJ-9]
MLDRIKARLCEQDEITQRYIALNGFDGILTVLGITVGAFTTRVSSPAVLISAGMGTAVGLFVSGFSGAYITEKAQRLKDFKDLKDKMLDDMENSRHKEDVEAGSIVSAIFNSLSPFVFAFLCIIPYILARAGIITMLNTAYWLSLLISASTLALLGGYLGSIARESVAGYALKMVGVGAITAALTYALGLGGL